MIWKVWLCAFQILAFQLCAFGFVEMVFCRASDDSSCFPRYLHSIFRGACPLQPVRVELVDGGRPRLLPEPKCLILGGFEPMPKPGTSVARSLKTKRMPRDCCLEGPQLGNAWKSALGLRFPTPSPPPPSRDSEGKVPKHVWTT